MKMSEERLPELDNYLWTYREDSFLPHGRDDEPQADQHPILLSSQANDNGASECIFLLDQTDIDFNESAKRAIIIIDGKNSESVDFERARWKKLKEANATLSYWQQNDQGGWEKKA